MAGSSCTISLKNLPAGKRDALCIKLAFVADDTDGSFPSTAITEALVGTKYINQGYYLEAVKYVFGTTTPDASFSVPLNDPDGVDILGGELATLDGTGANGYALASIGSDHHTPYIFEQLTCAPASNSTNDATFDFYLYFVRG